MFVTPELLQNASSSGAQAVIKIDDSKAEGKVFGLNEFRETRAEDGDTSQTKPHS